MCSRAMCLACTVPNAECGGAGGGWHEVEWGWDWFGIEATVLQQASSLEERAVYHLVHRHT